MRESHSRWGGTATRLPQEPGDPAVRLASLWAPFGVGVTLPGWLCTMHRGQEAWPALAGAGSPFRRTNAPGYFGASAHCHRHLGSMRADLPPQDSLGSYWQCEHFLPSRGCSPFSKKVICSVSHLTNIYPACPASLALCSLQRQVNEPARPHLGGAGSPGRGRCGVTVMLGSGRQEEGSGKREQGRGRLGLSCSEIKIQKQVVCFGDDSRKTPEEKGGGETGRGGQLMQGVTQLPHAQLEFQPGGTSGDHVKLAPQSCVPSPVGRGSRGVAIPAPRADSSLAGPERPPGP